MSGSNMPWCRRWNEPERRLTMGMAKRADRRLLAVQADDHVTGGEAAAVTIVAYCDFECPYCARAQQVMSQLLRHYGDRVRFVFRHFPLVHKHPFAEQAAEFAEAAAAQGRFWPMHDFLYTYQDTLDLGDLYAYAGKIGLDVPRIQAEMAGRVHAARVQRDLDAGRRLGVTGTPTLFLNDVPYQDEDEVARLVRRAA